MLLTCIRSGPSNHFFRLLLLNYTYTVGPVDLHGQGRIFLLHLDLEKMPERVRNPDGTQNML